MDTWTEVPRQHMDSLFSLDEVWYRLKILDISANKTLRIVANESLVIYHQRRDLGQYRVKWDGRQRFPIARIGIK